MYKGLNASTCEYVELWKCLRKRLEAWKSDTKHGSGDVQPIQPSRAAYIPFDFVTVAQNITLFNQIL